MRLSTEIGAVDKEQNVARTSVFDEPITEGTGGQGFAGASCHLNKRAGIRFNKGLFQVCDCFNTTSADAAAVVRMLERHFGHATPERVWLFNPGC